MYHEAADLFVMGGNNVERTESYRETWTYDTDSGSWTEIETNHAPRARSRMAMVYDSNTNRILLYGGSTDSSYYGRDVAADTWEFELETATWRQLNISGGPQLEVFVTGAYDVQSRRFIVYGYTAQVEFQTWALDYQAQTWENMNPDNSPRIRLPGDAVYSPALDRVLIFGGAPGWPGTKTTTDKLWAYDYDQNRWELLSGAAE